MKYLGCKACCDEEVRGDDPADFLEEYEVKIREILGEAVNKKIKSEIEQLAQLETNRKKQMETIRKLENEVFTLKQNHKEELEKAVLEAKAEGIREILTYTVNDTVYYIDSEATHTKCDKCDGKGKVVVEVLGKEAEVKCPYCEYGRNYNYHYFPVQDKVSSIKLYVTRKDSWDISSSGVVYDRNVHVGLDGGFDMTLKDLYGTKEECQSVCDAKNQRMSKHAKE
jgi:uncharacterized Zn-finger protein